MILRLSVLLILFCGLRGRAADAGTFTPEVEGARVEVYKTVAGTELKVWILEPVAASGTNRPAMVFFFGGGWRTGSPAQFEGQARHVAERGMVAVLVEYRVESRQGVKPPECVSDARSCIRCQHCSS